MPGLAHDHRDAGRGGPQGSAEEGGSVIQPRVCDLSCPIPNKTFCLRSSLTRCHMKRSVYTQTASFPDSRIGPNILEIRQQGFQGNFVGGTEIALAPKLRETQNDVLDSIELKHGLF